MKRVYFCTGEGDFEEWRLAAVKLKFSLRQRLRSMIFAVPGRFLSGGCLSEERDKIFGRALGYFRWYRLTLRIRDTKFVFDLGTRHRLVKSAKVIVLQEMWVKGEEVAVA